MRTVVLSAILLMLASTSYGQNIYGGDCNVIGNGNTVCSGLQRAPFTEALGQNLLSKLPDKSKKVVLETIGSNADQAIGTQFQQFLRKHGYTVERHAIGMVSPPLDHPFTLQTNGNQYVVTVAPSAH